MHRLPIKWVVLIVIASKFVSLGLIALTTELKHDALFEAAATSYYHQALNLPPNRACGFKTFDGHHYLYLAEHGYSNIIKDRLFIVANKSPLWPFLIRMAAPLLGGSMIITALFLSNLFSLAAIALLYVYYGQKTDAKSANVFLFLMIFFSGNFFFNLAYSESLFLLLSFAFFFFFDRKSYLFASILAFLMPLTKTIGLFAFVPPLVLLWGFLLKKQRPPIGIICLFISPILGMCVYQLILWVQTGDILIYQKAIQVYSTSTGHSISSLLHSPFRAILGLFNLSIFSRIDLFLTDRLTFVLFVISLWILKRSDPSFFWYAFWIGVIPVMAGSFAGYMRYSSVNFPMMLALASLYSARVKNRTVDLSFALFLVLVYLGLLLKHSMHFWIS